MRVEGDYFWLLGLCCSLSTTCLFHDHAAHCPAPCLCLHSSSIGVLTNACAPCKRHELCFDPSLLVLFSTKVPRRVGLSGLTCASEDMYKSSSVGKGDKTPSDCNTSCSSVTMDESASGCVEIDIWRGMQKRRKATVRIWYLVIVTAHTCHRESDCTFGHAGSVSLQAIVSHRDPEPTIVVVFRTSQDLMYHTSCTGARDLRISERHAVCDGEY